MDTGTEVEVQSETGTIDIVMTTMIETENLENFKTTELSMKDILHQTLPLKEIGIYSHDSAIHHFMDLHMRPSTLPIHLVGRGGTYIRIIIVDALGVLKCLTTDRLVNLRNIGRFEAIRDDDQFNCVIILN